MMRHATCAAALLVAVAGVYTSWKPAKGSGAGSDGQDRPTPTVHVAPAEALDLPVYVQGLGRVAPANAVRIKSRVDGPIQRILYKEGDEVETGAPLVEIDPRPYQALLAEAEGQLARDQALMAAARADLGRSTSLLDKGFVTRQAFDQQSAQVGQLLAAIKADQGLVDAARLNLDFTTIRAPIAGRIGKRLLDCGNLVHASDGVALTEIVQLHPISVVVTVPQKALPEIRARHAQAPLVVDAMAPDEDGKLAEGRLVFISNEIDPETGTIELKAEFANEDDKLWPGQLVGTRIVTQLRKDVVAVPEAAILPGAKGKIAYVVGPDSRVAVRSVSLGLPAEGSAVIEAGLVAGETVVLDNQDLLAPGMLVHVESRLAERAAAKPSPEASPSGPAPI